MVYSLEMNVQTTVCLRMYVLPQVAQARYMSSFMMTFVLLRNSSDLYIYEDLYRERNKAEKSEKLTVEF